MAQGTALAADIYLPLIAGKRQRFGRGPSVDSPVQAIVNAPAGLNVRSGPSTSFPVVESLPFGTRVTYTAAQDGFAQLGPDRWVSLQWLMPVVLPLGEKAWEKAAEFVLKIEGELSLDPQDRGNWTGGHIGAGVLKGTKWGISAASYPHLDIASLTREQALEIYRRDYWEASGASEIAWPMSLILFDTAVNHGVGVAKELFFNSLPPELAYLGARLLRYIADPNWRRYGEAWGVRVQELRKMAGL